MSIVTNQPPLDPSVMSPEELIQAMDDKELRPLIILALPSMLIRELQHSERDNVDNIITKQYIK
jgi:hypothetical protein